MDSLFYRLDRLYQITSIPIRVFNASGKLQLFNQGYEPSFDPFLKNTDFKNEIMDNTSKTLRPFLKTEENTCIYGIARDKNTYVIVMGPILARKFGDVEREQYSISHDIPTDNIVISSVPFHVLATSLALIHFDLNGEKLDENSIDLLSEKNPAPFEVDENAVNQYMMANADNEIKHISYNEEFLYLKQIREGDVDGISKHIDANFDLTTVGQQAKKPLKHFEYMICSSITLATRAAIDGGVSPDVAYATSDLYMQRLEYCKSVNDFICVQVEMKLAYAKQVKNSRENQSKIPHVQKCKTYISNHKNVPFELEDLANDLGFNKAYLSRKFKEETGMSIMQYARNARIEAAANMLKYSDEPISTIANYLCFPSQSHFGAVFKQIMKMSPQKYRDIEKKA